MNKKYVDEVRSFNRFYTAIIGALNEKFLNDKYTLPELRVLQAIQFRSGIRPNEISAELNMDKGYLSRVLLKLQQTGLVSKQVSATDGRVQHLYLTGLGKKEFEIQDAATYKHVKNLTKNLSVSDKTELVECMSRIKTILSTNMSTKPHPLKKRKHNV